MAGNRASWIRGPSQTTFSQAPNQALTTMLRCVHRRRERGLIFLSTQVGERGVVLRLLPKAAAGLVPSALGSAASLHALSPGHHGSTHQSTRLVPRYRY